MNARRKILDDISKLANSTAGVIQGAANEAESLFRQRFEALLDRMDLVTRDEFDAVKAMAEAARRENEALAGRLAALEKDAKPARPASAKRTTRASASAKAGESAKTAKTAKAAKAKKPTETSGKATNSKRKTTPKGKAGTAKAAAAAVKPKA